MDRLLVSFCTDVVGGLAQLHLTTSLTCRRVESKEVNSGLNSTTVMVDLKMQTVSSWVKDANVPLTVTVSYDSWTPTPILLGGQTVAHKLHAAQKPSWIHTVTSLLGDLSSSVFKVIMVPHTRLWENTSQEGMLRPLLTDHLKKHQVSKDIFRKDPRMTFGDLWGSRPTTSYLEAAPRARHPLDSSGYVSCDPWA